MWLLTPMLELDVLQELAYNLGDKMHIQLYKKRTMMALSPCFFCFSSVFGASPILRLP